MSEYYLRVEGVNLSSVLEDTAQLSVIRGGCLLLRQAVRYISKKYAARLKPLSTGASTGLFQIMSSDAHSTRKDVAEDLAEHRHYKHFTFAVDIQPELENFRKTQEAITARNRFRQLRQVSVALPPLNQDESKPCKWDNLRPGLQIIEAKRDEEKPPIVSQSVKTRYDFGRWQKRAFYALETMEADRIDGRIRRLRYTNEFNEIAECSPLRNLENKLAVLYFDGNSFGAIQRENCKDAEALKSFDETVQGYRRTFLKDFLLKISNYSDFKVGNRLRLETLLWGGDEITLVVPAWKGFWTLNYFYEQSEGWKYENIPLTHAGGLVFCHYKTPIVRTRKLAKDLADQVKDYLGKERLNRFEYAVLESIDFPTEPVAVFWDKRFGKVASCRQPLPQIPDWDKTKSELKKLLKDIPKGQVYALANKGVEDPGTGFGEQRKRFIEVIGKDRFGKLEAEVKQLFKNAACEVWPWVHLLELWDYLALDLEGPDHA